MGSTHEYAAIIRPAVDRVYRAMRNASLPELKKLREQTGFSPGFILSFYFGLLARPMPAAGFAAATTYSGGDMTEELEHGIAVVDDAGTWYLTESGRELALAVQRTVAAGAHDHWSVTLMPTQPGLAALPELADLLGKLLDAGLASGGPAFLAMAPVFAPANATAELLVSSRLGALRHYRGDAHRAAWAAAGLSLEELLAVAPDEPRRDRIEADTNARDAVIYETLTESERLRLLGLLAALPG